MSRYIFSKNNRWYISQIFNPSDSKLQEKAAYYTLINDVTGPYYISGTSDSASIVVSCAPASQSIGQLEAGVIDANGNFQPLTFNGTQASDSGSAIQGLQPKIFNTGHAEPVEESTGGALQAGVINADGDFQPLSFNGTQASDSGSAIQGLEPAIFNTGHEEPDYGNSSAGSGMEFYKCASVQESPDAWQYTVVGTGSVSAFSGDYYFDSVLSQTDRPVYSCQAEGMKKFLRYDGEYWCIGLYQDTFYCEYTTQQQGIQQITGAWWADISVTRHRASSGVLNTWTGYKAVFNSTAGTWGYQSDSTSLTWTDTKPVINNVYSADMTVQVTLLSGNSNTN